MVDDLITFWEYLTAISAHCDIHCAFQEWKKTVNIFILALRILFCLLDDFGMTTEQRTNLKFLVHLGKSLSEALCMLQYVYKEQTC